MTAEQFKAITLEGFERMFNNGELDQVDQAIAPDAIDHQEPAGTDFRSHLKEVISVLRTAFPDLRFEVHDFIVRVAIVHRGARYQRPGIDCRLRVIPPRPGSPDRQLRLWRRNI